MSANACYNVVGIDAVIDAQISDHVRNRVQLHDLAVDDRIARKIFKSEIHQAEVVAFTFEFDHLDRARSDIQTGDAFLLTEQHLFCSLFSKSGDLGSVRRVSEDDLIDEESWT